MNRDDDTRSVCQWCGGSLSPDADACPHCGALVPDSGRTESWVPGGHDEARARSLVESVTLAEHAADDEGRRRNSAEDSLVTMYLALTGIVVIILGGILFLPVILADLFGTFLGIDAINLREIGVLLVMLAALVLAGLLLAGSRRSR